MAPPGTTLHLPNGQILTVSPVFGGYSFKANDLNVHHSIFPPGWSIIINTRDSDDAANEPLDEKERIFGSSKHSNHRFSQPTLHDDNMYISTISNPSNTDFKPATSPTRQIAMMLWASLWWYFHLVCLHEPIRICFSDNELDTAKPTHYYRYKSTYSGGRKA